MIVLVGGGPQVVQKTRADQKLLHWGVDSNPCLLWIALDIVVGSM